MKPFRPEIIANSERVELHLLKAIVSIKTTDEAKCFLQDLCTPAELQAMADRWRVIPLIKSGKSYRQIYAETGVSLTTIGRIARSLMFGEGGYNLIYKRLEKKDNAKNTIKKDGNNKRN